jgi:hypothetical protein
LFLSFFFLFLLFFIYWIFVAQLNSYKIPQNKEDSRSRLVACSNQSCTNNLCCLLVLPVPHCLFSQKKKTKKTKTNKEKTRKKDTSYKGESLRSLAKFW